MLDALASNRKSSILRKTQLQQELQLISKPRRNVSDSGTHIAAMLGEKSSRFGSKTSVCCVSPFNQPMENALVSDIINFQNTHFGI
jgi:hypothetical protein